MMKVPSVLRGKSKIKTAAEIHTYPGKIDEDIFNINIKLAEIKQEQKSVLTEAEEITSKNRAETHGDFRDNFETAVRLFNIWTDNDLNAYDVAKMLKCLKMARMKAAPFERDNYVDDAGYTKLLHKLITEY